MLVIKVKSGGHIDFSKADCICIHRVSFKDGVISFSNLNDVRLTNNMISFDILNDVPVNINYVIRYGECKMSIDAPRSVLIHGSKVKEPLF